MEPPEKISAARSDSFSRRAVFAFICLIFVASIFALKEFKA